MAMENKRQIILVALAVVAGIGATLLTSKYVTDRIEAKTQELHDQYVQQQKQIMEELREQNAQQVAGLREEIARVRQESQDAVQKATAAAQAQAVASKTKQGKHTTFLTMKTPAGKRAVTVLIDSLSAVGGLLNAGDFVDVIAHLNIPEEMDSNKKKTITAMVFQDLQVLAINTNLDEPGDYDTQQGTPALKITFAVDPQEAGLLAFANINGKLELALRSTNENDKQAVKASTWKTLADYVLQNQGTAFDVPEEGGPTQPVTKDNKPYIQIFRGGKEL